MDYSQQEMMTGRIQKTVNDMRGLINEWSAPVLLAVSGGIDSMCMADLFVSCFPAESIAIAHCNFCLRSDESDADEAMVRSWAKEHGITCHVKSFDTRGFAAERGVSIEMAARELRYSWFADLCHSEGYCAVAVAHNANDNAETLILNLVRGTGIDGLAGMSAVSDLPYSDGSVRLLRPLLGCTRKQIEGHVFAGKVPYREDSTNSSSEYKRNRIRNEVLPIFGKLNPSVVRTLNRDMDYFSEASGIVDEWCRANSPAVVTTREPLGISIPALKAVPHWRYLLYHLLEPFGFNSSILASLEDLLVSDRTVSGKRFESDRYELLTERDELVVREKRMKIVSDIPTSLGETVMTVRGAGTYHFNGSSFEVELLEWKEDMPLRQPEGVLIMDAEKLRFPFVLRPWRNGDWLVPLGMRGKKKVSDLFTDLKYDTSMKEDSVIIVDVLSDGMAACQHVAAVAGVRMDRMYKVTSDTSMIVRISVARP